MLQRFEYSENPENPEGGSDCLPDNPLDCWFPPTAIDLSEYSMHLLSNIVNSGNPNYSKIPEYLNFTTSDGNWEIFNPQTPRKNILYTETMNDSQLEFLKFDVPDDRLNHFYVSRQLVLDFEKDRKSQCSSKTRIVPRKPEIVAEISPLRKLAGDPRQTSNFFKII